MGRQRLVRTLGPPCCQSLSTLCPEAGEKQLSERLMACSDLTFEPNKQLLEVELHKVEDLH